MALWKCNICPDDEGQAFRTPIDEIGRELMKAHLEGVHGVDYQESPTPRYGRNDPAQQWNQDLKENK